MVSSPATRASGRHHKPPASSTTQVANGAGATSGRKRRPDDINPDQGVAPNKSRKQTLRMRALDSRDRSQHASRSNETQEEEPPAPPPPSTRKIARRRESAYPASSPESGPSRGAGTGRQLAESRLGEELEEEDAEPSVRPRSLFNPQPRKPVKNLNFKAISRPRPSAAPPPSPPSGLPPASIPPPASTSRRPRKSRAPAGTSDSVVLLPVADTPVIDRNRGMRKDADRRNSLGKRGQRASGSFGRGEPSYPHSSVKSSQFYRHIPPADPEPHKVRWLVVWCAQRAMEEYAAKLEKPSKGKQRAVDGVDVDSLLGDVMNDFAQTVARGDVDTNVFGMPGEDHAGSALPIRPHPRNVENRNTTAKEEEIIRRLKAEDIAWNRIGATANHLQEQVIGELQTKARSHADPIPTEEWFQRALAIADDVLASGDGNVGSVANFAEVEYEVDMLHQTVHQARQYSQHATRFLDGIFSSLTADLRARSGDGRAPLPATDSDAPDTVALLSTASSSTSAATDPIHMLRALAAADTSGQPPEVLARAAALAPVSATPRKAPGVRRATAVGTTPRRAGVYGGRGTPARGK